MFTYLHERHIIIPFVLSFKFLTICAFPGRGWIRLGFDCAIGNPRLVLLVLHTVTSRRRCFDPTFRHEDGFWVFAANDSYRFVAHTSGGFIPLFSSHCVTIAARNGFSKYIQTHPEHQHKNENVFQRVNNSICVPPTPTNSFGT